MVWKNNGLNDGPIWMFNEFSYRFQLNINCIQWNVWAIITIEWVFISKTHIRDNRFGRQSLTTSNDTSQVIAFNKFMNKTINYIYFYHFQNQATIPY